MDGDGLPPHSGCTGFKFKFVLVGGSDGQASQPGADRSDAAAAWALWADNVTPPLSFARALLRPYSHRVFYA